MSENSFKKNTLLGSIKESVETGADNSQPPANTGERFETTHELLNKVLKEKKKNSKFPHTIYLSEKIGGQLEEYARQARKSKSAIIEELLESIFPE